jgi:hypothetical protein
MSHRRFCVHRLSSDSLRKRLLCTVPTEGASEGTAADSARSTTQDGLAALPAGLLQHALTAAIGRLDEVPLDISSAARSGHDTAAAGPPQAQVSPREEAFYSGISSLLRLGSGLFPAQPLALLRAKVREVPRAAAPSEAPPPLPGALAPPPRLASLEALAAALNEPLPHEGRQSAAADAAELLLPEGGHKPSFAPPAHAPSLGQRASQDSAGSNTLSPSPLRMCSGNGYTADTSHGVTCAYADHTAQHMIVVGAAGASEESSVLSAAQIIARRVVDNSRRSTQRSTGGSRRSFDVPRTRRRAVQVTGLAPPGMRARPHSFDSPSVVVRSFEPRSFE